MRALELIASLLLLFKLDLGVKRSLSKSVRLLLQVGAQFHLLTAALFIAVRLVRRLLGFTFKIFLSSVQLRL